ncbi:putative prefoldin subunit 2 [Vitis vinifera]|uniref:Putative prefoldin subunit 2 n=1 Tax=Vitis vinifera TaxID=29760 RepID=A0A438KLT5_VITVI|nr:putative prefoldin subunit 2 [Vitis vinifera]
MLTFLELLDHGKAMMVIVPAHLGGLREIKEDPGPILCGSMRQAYLRVWMIRYLMTRPRDGRRGATRGRKKEKWPVQLMQSVEQELRLVMAGKAGGDLKEPVNEQAVANIYGAMRAELNQIYSKITELEMEVSEHSLVIGAIQPLDPSRRCYRMIGGVLVERTIKEVLPAVQRNKEGLEEVISRLNEALEKKKKEIAEFEAKYKIRIRKSDGEVKDENEKKEGSAQGVLVGPASTNE